MLPSLKRSTQAENRKFLTPALDIAPRKLSPHPDLEEKYGDLEHAARCELIMEPPVSMSGFWLN